MDEGRTFPLPAMQSWAWQNQLGPARVGGAAGGRASFVTIVTADRAAQSRVFARSARACHPHARLVVLVPDTAAPPRIFADLYDLVIPAEELPLAGLADMRFRYSAAELCFALKPWVIRHLLDRLSEEPIYYFDSDIELFTPLAEAEAALAHGANLVLTPHILQPGLDQGRERALLRSGSFNAGFLAIAPSAPARAFVAWWCDRVRTGCTDDPLEGTYGDQKWLELAPSICDGVAVLRHPGYNFAYWNAHERPLSCLDGVWSAAGWPLRFVHYSQWNLQQQDAEQYLAGYFLRDYQPFAGLFAEYQKKVRDESPPCEAPAPGGAGERHTPSAGPVPEVIRLAYARHGPAVDGDASAVFGRAVAVLNAPSTARPGLPDLPVTVLYDEIWRHHADLRYRFDVEGESGRLAYLRWLIEVGAAKLGIPAVFLGPARSAVERDRTRQLEAGEETAAPSPAIADPAAPEAPASADTVAALIAARDAERDRIRRQHDDIRLLVSSNRGLRREVQSLRVRRWRDDETIRALEQELLETRRAREAATRRNRQLADEVAALRSRPWRALVGRLSRRPRPTPTGSGRRQVLAGDGPFFKRGFRLSEAAAIAGDTVKRIKAAPSGTVVFGPYIALPPGRYAVAIEARLYRRLATSANFRVDVVRDGARQVIALRKFRLPQLARRRRFELSFTVLDGEDSPDFEVRIWARKGTPLEIGRIELYRLTEEPPAEAAAP